MRTSFQILLFIVSSTLLFSCEEEGANSPRQTYGNLVIGKDLYDSIKSENFLISSVSISGDSLKIKLCSGGCSGETWDVRLVDSGAVAESFPEQRWAKVGFKNEEICYAYICREYIFDLKPLQTGSGKLSLHLDGWDGSLLYEY
jgi:hypothetical protein